MKPCIYVNPNAPADLKDTMAEYFFDLPRVSAAYLEELTGGLVGSPTLADYAAVIVDENGELTLFSAGLENMTADD